MNRQLTVIAAFLLSAGMMGCTKSTPGPAWSLLSNGLGGPAVADSQKPEDDMVTLHTPTVANKTLSAMALERATGLKPVPSRLVKFD